MSDVNNVKNTNVFVTIWKGLRSEWIKIIFPSNEQVLRDSITVLVCSIIIGFIIFALDSLIGSGFGFLFNM